MPIVGALPFNILDGQPEVAGPVMGNFNFLASQVNANVPALIPVAGTTPIYVPTVGGSSAAVTLTPATPLSAYAAGTYYTFLAPGTNVGGVTINVSGLGTRSLLYADGTAMTGFEIHSGQNVAIQDNGSNFVLMSPPAPSGIQVAAATLTFGGASVGVTFSTDTINYYKQGRVLTYLVAIVLTSKGSSTGAARVGGLPYVVNGSWGVGVNQVGGGLFTSAVNFTNGYNAAFLSAGLSTIALVNVPTGGGAATFLTDTNFANNSQVYISGSYIV